MASLPKRRYCAHCSAYVSSTTYRRHREELLRNVRMKLDEQEDNDSDKDEWIPSQQEFNDGGLQDNDELDLLHLDCSDDERLCDTFESSSSLPEADEEVVFDSETEDEEAPNPESCLLPPILRSLILFLLLWQYLFNVSDTGLSVIIVYVYNLIHSICGNEVTRSWIGSFPVSFHEALQKIIGSEIKFTEYVVCPKCHALYDGDSCIITCGSNKSSRKCEYIQFPNHSQSSFRQPCGTLLLRSVKKTSMICFKPIKVYCYQSIKFATARLLKRPGFLEMCEHWRQRETVSEYLGDIYDGQVWKDLLSFLLHKYSWVLALNVDWFQPFSHVTDSVGAIYSVILNLPREERYKSQNMILVGIIPGPHEPSLNINSYLSPLVLELKQFYAGLSMQCVSQNGQTFCAILKLVLIGALCDLPASRKVCGFCSFNALHGCNRCLKTFPTKTFGERPDYSGYDRSLWPARTTDLHKEKSYQHLNATNKTEQKAIEREFGIRYSVMVELPFFNPVRHTVVDPVHNLFLGTAKYCVELWTKKEILTRTDIEKIEKGMTLLQAPHCIGRLPLKIGSGFSGFTADQWRNWTVCFSPVVLRGVLPREHLQYWLLFVKACSLLCTRCLRNHNIDLADRYLQMFCSKFQEVNGSEACTPNMHLHLHLKECLLDYGPVYAFWCFAFERYNGMLGKFPTNQKNIEPQLMKKCLILQELHSQSFPSEGSIFQSILEQHSPSVSGGLMMSMTGEDVIHISQFSTPLLQELDYSISKYETCLPPKKQIVLDCNMLASLQFTYKLLYPNEVTGTFSNLSRFAKKSSRVSFAGEVLGSKATMRDNNTVISAFWPSSSANNFESRNYQPSIGEVQFYVQHTVAEKEHLFAYVHWYEKHSSYDWFGSSAIVSRIHKEIDISCSFIPVKRISSLCVHGILTVSFTDQTENVLVAIPTNAKHCF